MKAVKMDMGKEQALKLIIDIVEKMNKMSCSGDALKDLYKIKTYATYAITYEADKNGQMRLF